jgi:cell division septation protein DedD
MTDTVEQDAAASRWQNLSEEKLLMLLLLGLGVLLLLILLFWKAVDSDAENDPVPVAEDKRSVWFDKDGPRLSADGAARAQQETAPAAVTTDAAEGLLVETVELENVAAPERNATPAYWILLATFSQIENADGLAKKVAPSASQVEVSTLQRQSGLLYSVRVPAYGSKQQAQKVADKLANSYGLQPLVVKATK